MAELKDLIADLNRSGLNDGDIAEELGKSGTVTTQATINRLKNGVHKSTNFELGYALLNLHRQRCGEAAA